MMTISKSGIGHDDPSVVFARWGEIRRVSLQSTAHLGGGERTAEELEKELGGLPSWESLTLVLCVFIVKRFKKHC